MFGSKRSRPCRAFGAVELDDVDRDACEYLRYKAGLGVNEQRNLADMVGHPLREPSRQVRVDVAGALAEKDEADMARPALDRGIDRLGRGKAADFG